MSHYDESSYTVDYFGNHDAQMVCVSKLKNLRTCQVMYGSIYGKDGDSDDEGLSERRVCESFSF